MASQKRSIICASILFLSASVCMGQEDLFVGDLSLKAVIINGQPVAPSNYISENPDNFYENSYEESLSTGVMTIIYKGSGSGTLDGNSFSDTDFVITAIGDIENRTPISGGWSLEHLSASITIDGVGQYDILTSTRTFVNNSIITAGFSRSITIGGADLFNIGHTEFGKWNLLDPIGPITGFGQLFQWNLDFLPFVETTGGTLIFNNNFRQATFAAVPYECVECCFNLDCEDDGNPCTANECQDGLCIIKNNCGTCCDASPGLGGSCTDGIMIDNCQDEFDSWSVDTLCSEIVCEEVTGACCDVSSGLGGLCLDQVIEADCQGDQQTWVIETSCIEITCEEVTGSCCDRLDGFCRNGLLQAECDGAQPIWNEGISCSEIICDPAIGACCNTRFGTCTNNLIFMECQGEQLSWTKGEFCNTENCPDPFIPTVSQWGLVIMTLVLLIGGKLYFRVKHNEYAA